MKRKSNKIASAKKKSRFVGMKPFDGYRDIAKQELNDLRKMTAREARIQTEILLLAAQWMK